MKIIFLDIDGVLNSMGFIEKHEKEIGENLGFLDEDTVKLLQEIVVATNAKIVLSSSWRSMFDDEMNPRYDAAQELLNMLKKYNLKLIGKTGHIDSMRGAEVRAWLAEHDDIENFVILDDAPFSDWNELTANWVQTDFRTGLTATDVTKAIAILT